MSIENVGNGQQPNGDAEFDKIISEVHFPFAIRLELMDKNKSLREMVDVIKHEPEKTILGRSSIRYGRAAENFLYTKVEPYIFEEELPYMPVMRALFRQGFRITEQLLGFTDEDNADIRKEEAIAAYAQWMNDDDSKTRVGEMFDYLVNVKADTYAHHLFGRNGEIRKALRSCELILQLPGTDETVRVAKKDRSASLWRREGMLAALFLMRYHTVASVVMANQSEDFGPEAII